VRSRAIISAEDWNPTSSPYRPIMPPKVYISSNTSSNLQTRLSWLSPLIPLGIDSCFFLSKVCQLETLNIQDCPAPRNILLHRPPPMGPQVHPNPTAPPYTRLQTKELRSSVLHDCATTWGWAVPGSTSAKGEWQDDRDSRRYNLV
jgi:hypothetical protein